jgi:hypothetical protein
LDGQNEVEKNRAIFRSTTNVGNWEALGSKFDSFNQRSAVKAKGAMAKPKYDTPMLAVYAGQTCIGHIYQRKAGFEAFNTDDRSIGLFGSQREAADALSSGAHRMAETAGATVTEVTGLGRKGQWQNPSSTPRRSAAPAE